MAHFRLSDRARKFLREVGSIVLGVLIALGIGEVADDLRWRSRAAESDRAMNVELARAAGVLQERMLVQRCLSRRLDDLAGIVRTARRTRMLPDIGEIGQPPLRPLETAAWDDAVANGVLLHLEDKRRSVLSSNYPLLKNFPRDTAQEIAAWAHLRMLEGVPGPASDGLLVEAAGIIAQLQWGSQIMGLTAEQVEGEIAGLGIKPSYYIMLGHEGTLSEVADAQRRKRRCEHLRVV